MSGTNTVKLPRKPKGQRPQYFDDPAIDRLVGMIMALAGEVAVMHDRHDTFERIAAEKGLIGRDEIESYRPSAEVAADRDRWREIYLGEVLRVVQQDLEALEQDRAEPYDKIVEIISEE